MPDGVLNGADVCIMMMVIIRIVTASILVPMSMIVIVV